MVLLQKTMVQKGFVESKLFVGEAPKHFDIKNYVGLLRCFSPCMS